MAKPAYDLANIFSNYFSLVAETTKQNFMNFQQYFTNYLKHQCNISIFIQPTDSDEITNIISTLNMNKSIVPNSIPHRILNLKK